MAEAEYQNECVRAELLGYPKPDMSEFLSRQRQTAGERNEEEIPTDEVEEGVRKEGFQRIGGGLEELNSILSSTQRKLNRFKTVCGNFGSYLKIQMGARKGGNEKPDHGEADACNVEEPEKGKETMTAGSESPTPDIRREGNVELDKLDFLISRAEKAELSLSSQNKQIKKILN